MGHITYARKVMAAATPSIVEITLTPMAPAAFSASPVEEAVAAEPEREAEPEGLAEPDEGFAEPEAVADDDEPDAVAVAKICSDE
jgi:hypothetical protein